MRNSLLKPTLTAIFLSLIFVSSLMAQPPKARERIEQLKKIKLLEVLDLKDDQADKFLIKYSQFEKSNDELRRKMATATKELRDAVKNNNTSEMKAKSDELVKLESDLFNSMIEKKKAMKTVLTDEQYAKFLIFEQQFMQELQKILMKKHCEDRDGDMPPFERGRK